MESIKQSDLEINKTLTSSNALTNNGQTSNDLISDATASNHQSTTSNLGDNTLELLAERPKVEIERLPLGKVRLSKQVKSQTINVPVTLTQEYLVIEHVPFTKALTHDKDFVSIDTVAQAQPATIMVNGEQVNLTDTPHEILLSQQVARVAIETLVSEKVTLSTTSTKHEKAIPVTLRHEELVAEEVKVENPTVLSSTTLADHEIDIR